jgi:pyruvate formate lyase activating enzyme
MAASVDKNIALHITRFFPEPPMADRPATPVKTIKSLCDAGGEYLNYVYAGNC